ncbi:hypothetical protein DFH06DRAFT_1068594, partial [Mycena polygramma]
MKKGYKPQRERRVLSPTMSQCPQLTKYAGNCHCGAFKFTITTHAQLKQVAICSCGICSKNGYLWFFPARADHFAIVKGGEDISLATYNFEMMAHKDAALWTYPAATAVTFTALDQLQEYMFGRKFVFHGFCKICGVSICQRFLPNAQRTD